MVEGHIDIQTSTSKEFESYADIRDIFHPVVEKSSMLQASTGKELENRGSSILKMIKWQLLDTTNIYG